MRPSYHTGVHHANASNSRGNITVVGIPALDDEPGALPQVTRLWNPDRSPVGTFNDHEIGLWYSERDGRWAVFNQDQQNISLGAWFHLVVPNSGARQFRHKVQVTNKPSRTSHRTFLQHPELDGNPGAELFVSQVYESGGPGVYNDHAVGVWYDSSAGRWEIFNQDLDEMPLDAQFNVLIADDRLAFSNQASTHVASAASTSGSRTLISHAKLDGNPDARVLLTQYFNHAGVYNPHPIGAFYDQSAGRWGVFNEDLAAMPLGAAFFMLIVDAGDAMQYAVHDADSGNTAGHVSRMNLGVINGEPDAPVFTTQNWNPNGSPGVYNANPTGVYYQSSNDRWAVFNQNFAAMPDGASFNVLVPNASANTFIVTADSGNTSGHVLRMDHPSLDRNADAIVFVQPLWNLPGQLGTYNPHEIGVYYRSSDSRWTIFNQDRAAMPAGANFLVLVADGSLDARHQPLVHVAEPANTGGHITRLDHPVLDGNPNAQVTVTQNWSVRGVYNDHPIGVYYSGGRWRIFNQDFAAMPDGAAFNVLINERCR